VTSSRCAPFCRDPRPPASGVAARLAKVLDRADIPPEVMTGYLATTFQVRRFADLCFSHADAILIGATKGILLDDLRSIRDRE
jgi:hypothetical protein